VKVPMLRYAVLTLGIWCCASVAAQAQSKDAAKFFPDNTQMVFSVNVKALLGSSLFQKHFKEDVEKQIKEQPQIQKVVESMGFDPLRDISTVSLTLNKFDVTLGSEPDVDLFVVIKGNFSTEKMNAAISALIASANQGDRVSSSRYGDFTMFEAKDRRGKSVHWTIFDKETVFVGNVKNQVTDAIERGLGKKTGTLNSKFAELMGRARAEASFWGAMIMPNSVKELSRMSPNPDAGEAISKLDSITLKFDVKDNIKFDYSMFLADAGAADKLKTLIDQAREMLGAAALQNEQFGAELGDLVSSIQVASKDNKVSVSGEVKSDLAEKIIKLIKEQRGR
jgi:hypothetical protein